METNQLLYSDFQSVHAGDQHTFKFKVARDHIKNFANLSGDHSSLHTCAKTATKRGFPDQVVHGAFLTSLFSQLIGMHLPGENALLQTLNLKFLHPVFPNDELEVFGIIVHKSEATQTIELKLKMTNLTQDNISARGKALVGFTKELASREQSVTS